MKADTYKAYVKVLRFYEIDLPDKLIRENIEASKGKGNAKDNLRSEQVLPWGLSSNFRSGNIADWRKEYSQMNFDLAKELLGQALVDSGYEKDLNW